MLKRGRDKDIEIEFSTRIKKKSQVTRETSTKRKRQDNYQVKEAKRYKISGWLQARDRHTER